MIAFTYKPMNIPQQLIKRRIDFEFSVSKNLLVGMYIGINLVDASPSVVIAQIMGTKKGNDQFLRTWDSKSDYTEKLNGWFVTGVLTAILVERRFGDKDIETVNMCVEFLNAMPLEFEKGTNTLEDTFSNIKNLRLDGLDPGQHVQSNGVKNLLRTYETYIGECIDVFNRLNSNTRTFKLDEKTKKILEKDPIKFNSLITYQSEQSLLADVHIDALMELKWTRFRAAMYTKQTARRVVTHVITDVPEKDDEVWSIDKTLFGVIYWPRFISEDYNVDSRALVSSKKNAYEIFEIIIGALLEKYDHRIVLEVQDDVYIDVAKIYNMAEKIIALNPMPKMSRTDSSATQKRKVYVRENIEKIRRENLACILALGAAYKMPTYGSLGIRKILEMWNLMINLYTGPDVEFNFFEDKKKLNERCKGHVAELMLRVYVDRFVMTDVDPRLPKPGLQWGNYARYLDGIYQSSKRKGFFPLYWPWEGEEKKEIDVHSLVVQLAYAYPASLTDLPYYLKGMVSSFNSSDDTAATEVGIGNITI